MTETIEVQPGTCQTITIPANDHAVNGHLLSSIAGPSAALAEVLPTPSAVPSVSFDLCCRAIGLAVAGAAVGHSTRLQTPNGLLLNAGFNLIIAAADPTPALTALTHILAPLKREQINRHATLATLDRETHQQQIDQARAESAIYQEGDTLPNPTHLDYYSQQIAGLEDRLKPMLLLENPSPGRLTLAMGKSADSSLLAVYDDLHFQALLNASRSSRGHLDLELLAKSSRQEIFDAGFLEGVHEAAIACPAALAVIIASPETVAKLLMDDEPQVTAFADTCIIFNEPGEEISDAGYSADQRQLGFWREAVSRLLAARPEESRIVGMDGEAVTVINAFEQEIRTAIQSGPGEQSRHLAQLPRLARKIALALWAGYEIGSGFLTAECASAAIEVAKLSRSTREAILQSNGRTLADTEFEADCRKVLDRIAISGPTTIRELCRHIYKARTEWLLPILLHLVNAERLLKLPDDKFALPEQHASKLQLVSV